MSVSISASSTQIVTISLLGVMGLFPVLVLPIFLGALTVLVGLPEVEAARVCSAYLVGVAVGAGIATFFGHSVRPMYMARFGSITFGLASFMCIAVSDYTGLLILQAIAGLGAGAAVAVAVGIFARTASPTRAYAIYTSMVFGVSSVGLFASPYILMHFEMKGMFILAVLFAVTGFTASRALRSYDAPGKNLTGKGGFSFKGVAIFALLAFFVFEVANGSAWAFTERLGASYNFAQTDIGFALTASSLLGFSGALLALFMAERAGRKLPVYLALGMLTIAVVGMTRSSNYNIYFIANAVLGFFWAFTLPYFQSLLAAFDPTGKLASAGLSVDMAALSAGPFVASFILPYGIFAVMWFSAVVYIASGFLYSVAIFFLVRDTTTEVSAGQKLA